MIAAASLNCAAFSQSISRLENALVSSWAFRKRLVRFDFGSEEP
jgi:hypothetical protein